MNKKIIIVGVIALVAVIGGIVAFQGGLFHKPSDLRYDYDETLYYTMQGAVPYGDDHLFTIKAWNKSDEIASLPLHFKFVFKNGTEITASGVGHSFSNYDGAHLKDWGLDSKLHTSLAPGEVVTYKCIIHVSGYDSKLDGKLVCTDEGWEHYDF